MHEPHHHYWHVLYPEYADPARAHWLAKFKTLLMCMGLFGERQQARHEWIATGPRRGRLKPWDPCAQVVTNVVTLSP
jgi:hypothetical protein